MKAREIMVQASMVAGMAFTNVSLGIVHSMAHTIGGYFHVAHGLADAILLPYIIRFNSADERAAAVYARIARKAQVEDLGAAVEQLNERLNIPASFRSVIADEEKYMGMLDELAEVALADGCTKTNPIIPSIQQLKGLFVKAYRGE